MAKARQLGSAAAAAALSPALREVASAWAASPLRPIVPAEVEAGWDQLLHQWLASSLPLVVRSARLARGAQALHVTGRAFTVSDNTCAHWALASALDGSVPTLEQIGAMFDQGAMPLAFALKAAERSECVFAGRLPGSVSRMNAEGWKVCHIQRVSTGSRVDWVNAESDGMKAHFLRFLSPRNMFVVPLRLGGLGELPEMTDAIQALRH